MSLLANTKVICKNGVVRGTFASQFTPRVGEVVRIDDAELVIWEVVYDLTNDLMELHVK